MDKLYLTVIGHISSKLIYHKALAKKMLVVWVHASFKPKKLSLKGYVRELYKLYFRAPLNNLSF
jgi:hypothetical protein